MWNIQLVGGDGVETAEPCTHRVQKTLVPRSTWQGFASLWPSVAEQGRSTRSKTTTTGTGTNLYYLELIRERIALAL